MASASAMLAARPLTLSASAAVAVTAAAGTSASRWPRHSAAMCAGSRGSSRQRVGHSVHGEARAHAEPGAQGEEVVERRAQALVPEVGEALGLEPRRRRVERATGRDAEGDQRRPGRGLALAMAGDAVHQHAGGEDEPGLLAVAVGKGTASRGRRRGSPLRARRSSPARRARSRRARARSRPCSAAPREGAELLRRHLSGQPHGHGGARHSTIGRGGGTG